jgi:hypothetical protein
MLLKNVKNVLPEVGKLAAVRTRTRKSLHMKLFHTIMEGSRCSINIVITSQYTELNHLSSMSSDLIPLETHHSQ